MRPRVLMLAALVVSSLAPGMVGAQQDASGRAPVLDAALAAGAPVRVKVPGRPRITGTLLRLDADSVQVRDGGRVIAVPRSQVGSIEVKSGGRSHGAGAAYGAAIGIATGAIVGAIGAYATWEPCPEGTFVCLTDSRGAETALGAFAYGVLGGTLGAIIGAGVGRQRWRQAAFSPETRVGLFATPSRVGVTLRI